MTFISAFFAFFLSLILTPLVRAVALKKGWIAQPRKERWHKKPTALSGGIAIYLAAAISLFYFADFKSLIPHLILGTINPKLPDLTAVVFFGMTFIFLLGLLDDFIRIKPHTKLVGQILVASMVTFLGFRLHWFVSLTGDTIVTIFWIVGITNAFNLIDNMDGLCAGVGFIAACYLALLFQTTSPEAYLLALILAGAIGGFLVYNFNPASIFMGDSGSLLIGFTLSTLCLFYSGERAGNRLAWYAVPVLLLMVPILDTTMVTIIRLLSGRKASVGGKDHTSHRLVLIGLSEKGAVLFLYGVGAISGFSAIFVSQSDTFSSPVVIIPLAVSILLMGIYLSQIRVYPEKEFSLLRGKVYTPILVELTFKRQILLVILDLCLIAFSYYLSYRLRFGSDRFPVYFKFFLNSLPAVIACKFIAFFAIGIYRGIWRYLSTNDVFVHLKASFLATILSFAIITYIYRLEDFSKSIFVIDFLLTTGLLLGTRGSFRIFLDTMKRRTKSGKPVIIYGAGQGGEILLREILNNKNLDISPIGFIDDDVLKTGKKLLGYTILGTFNDLEKLCEKHSVSGILKSFNHKESKKQKKIIQFCKNHNLFLKQFSIHLSDVEIENSETDHGRKNK
ncbi:MAG: glycosyl transferase [Desulfobacterales bacterium]|nr:glycosyl transferase [Desulfobacterales bacterium]